MSNGNKLNKIMGIALAGACTFAVATSFVGCTTNHPEAQIVISFNGENYTLGYKLYRKLAPSTVQHFIELADAKYYNGMCIHNYTSTKWYTGAYSYDAENTEKNAGLIEKNYFEAVKSISLTQTVWHDEAKQNPTYTLYGEFSANDFEVSSGALTQDFGSLSMYYTLKPSDNHKTVYALRSDGNGTSIKSYNNNSTTSLFYINVANNGKSDSYCTFATITEKSSETLTKLRDAISEYIADKKASDADYDFAPSKSGITTDLGNNDYGESTASYNVPQEPIVIKSVKIKKY